MIEIGVSLQGVKSCKLPLLTSCAGLLPSHRFTIPVQHPLQPASRSSPRNPAARCEMRGGSFPPACLRLHQRAENFLSSLPSTEGVRERTRLTALRIGSCWPCRSGDLSEKQVAKKSGDMAETLGSLERAQGPQGIILTPTKKLLTGPCFRTYSVQQVTMPRQNSAKTHLRRCCGHALREAASPAAAEFAPPHACWQIPPEPQNSLQRQGILFLNFMSLKGAVTNVAFFTNRSFHALSSRPGFVHDFVLPSGAMVTVAWV